VHAHLRPVSCFFPFVVVLFTDISEFICFSETLHPAYQTFELARLTPIANPLILPFDKFYLTISYYSFGDY
jgi:hypothetical protein